VQNVERLALVLLALIPLCQSQTKSYSPEQDGTLAATPQTESADAETLYERGRFAREGHRYSQALKWYRLSAAQDFSGAQVDLGFMYFKGLGVEKDPALAAYWYGLAAAKGDSGGEFGLGLCYQLGEGVEKSPSVAVKWFSLAFSHGDAWAPNSTGEVQELDNKDNVQAFHWYRKGAELGDELAQYNVCRFTVQAIGTSTNFSEALEWCSKAANKGGSWGQYGLGRIYEDGTGSRRITRKPLGSTSSLPSRAIQLRNSGSACSIRTATASSSI